MYTSTMTKLYSVLCISGISLEISFQGFIYAKEIKLIYSSFQQEAKSTIQRGIEIGE